MPSLEKSLCRPIHHQGHAEPLARYPGHWRADRAELVITEEPWVDVTCFGQSNWINSQPVRNPIILLAPQPGRSGRRYRPRPGAVFPQSAGHVGSLERPLSSASLLSSRSRRLALEERQFRHA